MFVRRRRYVFESLHVGVFLFGVEFEDAPTV